MRRYFLKQPGPYPFYVRVDGHGCVTSWTADRRRASHLTLRRAVNMAIVARQRVVIEPAECFTPSSLRRRAATASRVPPS